MDEKLQAVAIMSRPEVVITEFVEQSEHSRSSLYRWKDLFDAGGPEALVPKSRRPKRSPGRTPKQVEDRIVKLRKSLPIDAGSAAIHDALVSEGVDAPDVRTIDRILDRNGLVVAVPQRRSKASLVRFEARLPNELWQIDGTTHTLANGTEQYVIDVLDDHSRLCVASIVSDHPESAETAVFALLSAIEAFGAPARVLSDNGSAFKSKLFTDTCVRFGIQIVNSRPYHPQTCGKVERFHQTVKKGINRFGVPRSKASFDKRHAYVIDSYNNARRHSALERQVPIDVWESKPKAQPAAPIKRVAKPTVSISTSIVQPNGIIRIQRLSVSVGMRHAGTTITVIRYGTIAHAYRGKRHLGRINIDPHRRYQQIA